MWDSLKAIGQSLPIPEDYQKGIRVQRRLWPNNLVLFHRSTAKTLNRRNFADRLHHRYVLICVLDTSGTISLDGVDLLLKPGTALLVSPYQFHHYKDMERENLSWLFYTFDMERGGNELDGLQFQPVPLNQSVESSMLTIAQIWKRLSAEINEADGESAMVHLARILEEMILWVNRQDPRPLEIQRKTNDEWMARVMDEIRHSLSSFSSVRELAGRMGLSERQFRNRFRKATGYSVRDYRDKLRFIRAVSLLKSTQLTIGEISGETGFQSLQSFSRFIRNHSGQSPSALRKGDLLAQGAKILKV